MENMIATGSAVNHNCPEWFWRHSATSVAAGCFRSVHVEVCSPSEQRWKPGMQGQMETIALLLRFCHGGSSRHIAARGRIPGSTLTIHPQSFHSDDIVVSFVLKLQSSTTSDQHNTSHECRARRLLPLLCAFPEHILRLQVIGHKIRPKSFDTTQNLHSEL